jgi:tetratricopeptide (TPR) repeat protein
VSRSKSKRRSRRLNTRAAVILAGVLAVAVGGFFILKAIKDRSGSPLLVQAKALLEKNQPALALGFLNTYLERSPDDLEALDLKGKILSEGVRDAGQASAAIKVHRDVLGKAPDDPRWQDTRRRLVRLCLMVPGQAQAAEAQARELIQRGGDDAEAHRLLAQALEILSITEKKPELAEQARQEYEAAEAREPGDVGGAERLASLYRDRLEQPEKALRVLDHLVTVTEADPKKHAAALLARSRHFAAVRRMADAEADLNRAARDDPSDPSVRMAAAEAALQRRDTAAARAHLAAVEPAKRNELQAKVIEGMIDLVEQRPDDAIAAWKSGLVLTGGNNADLTWRLAQVLIETGRVDEAEPLITQYRRLVGGDEPDARYRYLRGMVLLKTNRPSEAIAELEAVRYKADRTLEPMLYYALGQAYEATRVPDKALDAYSRAAGQSKEWSAPWTAAARLQSTASRSSEAIDGLRKGLALNPDDPRLLTTLAQVLCREELKKAPAKRSWGEVERVLAQASKVAPGSPELALIRSDYLTATGRPDDALATLEAATKLNPRSPEVWLARASALYLRGHNARAIEVLDQAIASAGPQAGFYTTKATLQVLKGLYADARKTLIEGEAKVVVGQKATLWRALGDFYKTQNDLASARAAYTEWARLAPDNPEPRLSLCELELTTGDDARIARAVEEVRKVGGLKSYFWRLAKIEDLTRDRPKESPDPARDARRLEEADVLAREIQQSDPQLALGYLLEGRIAERRKRPDQAAEAYEKAVERGGGQAAIVPLVAILVKQNNTAALDRIRQKVSGLPGEFDRLAAQQALSVGNKERAEELSQKALQGDPQGLDTRVWHAEVLKKLGRPEEAEKTLAELIKQKPEAPSPRLSLLMLQLGRKDSKAAAETVEGIRTHVQTEFPELLLAQCYRAVGDYAKAATYYQEAMRKRPGDVAVLSSAAQFFESIGRRDESEQVLRAVRERDPSATWATRRLALSLASRVGNRAAWEEALKLVGPERRPDDVTDDMITRATVYAHSPEPAQRRKAVAVLEEVLAQMPTLAKVHEEVGRLLMSLGEKAKAREHAAKAAEGDRAAPEAILLYAGILVDAKDLDGAETQLARLVKIDPDGLPVAEVKARILAARGKGAEGAAILEKAFADRIGAPDALEVGAKMVPLLTTLGQPEAAERVARKLEGLGPRGRCVLAEFLAGHGKGEEAEAQVREAAKTDTAAAAATALRLAAPPGAEPRWLELARQLQPPDDVLKGGRPDQILGKAMVYHREKRYDKEIEAYKALYASRPTNFTFLNNMAWTYSEEMNQPEEGLKWANESINKVGAQPDILDTRGVILTRLKRYDEAQRDLESAARDVDANPAAYTRLAPGLYYHLARLYHAQGKTDQARDYRDRAAKAGLRREMLQPSELADWGAVMGQ